LSRIAGTIETSILLFLAAFVAAFNVYKPVSATPSQSAFIAVRVLDAQTGSIIPSTVTIKPSHDGGIIVPTDFGGRFRSDGEFEKTVPPGEITVTVSRGFDYLARQRTLNLRPAQHVQLTFRLRRQAGLRRAGWYCGDNHVHMIHGAEKVAVSFSEVALTARAAGLDYMSLAQNWNLLPAQTTPRRLTALCKSVSTPDFILTWNMEAPKNYWRGDVTHCLGHCWTLGMRGYTPDGQDAIRELFQMSALDYESAKTPTPNFESQALIHSLNGIVVYTHPCRWWWGNWGGKRIYPVVVGKFISNLAQELPYDTVVGPTYDGIDILMQSWDRKSYLEAQQLWFMLLNKGYHLPGTASTDASFDKPERALPGIVRVYTHVEGPPAIDPIAKAMKAGRNFVTSGPLLLMHIGGRQPGDVIHLDRPSDFQVQLLAWPSGIVGEHLTRVELIRNGEVIKSFLTAGSSREFTAGFTIHETGTAWYIALCLGSGESQVAITDPIYFEGSDYKPPQPTLAHVTAVVTGAGGKRLDGECDVIQMVGLKPVELSKHAFAHGQFTLDVPGTSRLRIVAAGYAPMTKSVFMDYEPLLRMTLNMREAELTDWRTFMQIKALLGHVFLQFQLTPSQSRR
jgi:hypothetical protein